MVGHLCIQSWVQSLCVQLMNPFIVHYLLFVCTLGAQVGGRGDELGVTVDHLKKQLQRREETHKIALQESKVHT